MDIYNFISANSPFIAIISILLSILSTVVAIIGWTQTHKPSKKIVLIVVASPLIFLCLVTLVIWNIWNNPQNLYLRATSGNPAFTDSLNIQDANNWTTVNNFNECKFVAGVYLVSLYDTNSWEDCVAYTPNFTNFAFQAQMSILEGDTGGLLFRANEEHDCYYFFISSDGSYKLYAAISSKPDLKRVTSTNITSPGHALEPLADGHITINTNEYNLLTVIAQNSHIYMYVNKKYITNINDSTFAFGQIGVAAEANGNATSVAFSNVQVWAL